MRLASLSFFGAVPSMTSTCGELASRGFLSGGANGGGSSGASGGASLRSLSSTTSNSESLPACRKEGLEPPELSASSAEGSLRLGAALAPSSASFSAAAAAAAFASSACASPVFSSSSSLSSSCGTHKQEHAAQLKFNFPSRIHPHFLQLRHGALRVSHSRPLRKHAHCLTRLTCKAKGLGASCCSSSLSLPYAPKASIVATAAAGSVRSCNQLILQPADTSAPALAAARNLRPTACFFKKKVRASRGKQALWARRRSAASRGDDNDGRDSAEES